MISNELFFSSTVDWVSHSINVSFELYYKNSNCVPLLGNNESLEYLIYINQERRSGKTKDDIISIYSWLIFSNLLVIKIYLL